MKKVRTGGFIVLLISTSLFMSAQQSTQKSDPATSSPIEQVIAKEKASWAAGKNKDKNAYAETLADDYAQVSTGIGRTERKAVLEAFDGEYLQDYSLGEIKGTLVAPDVVLLTYSYRVEVSNAGEPYEGKFFGSSLWANRGGKWVNVFFQETPLN